MRGRSGGTRLMTTSAVVNADGVDQEFQAGPVIIFEAYFDGYDKFAEAGGRKSCCVALP